MNRNKKLKESTMEKRLLTLFHEDGILDLMAGMIVLLFGLVTQFEMMGLIGLIAIPGTIYFPIKEKTTFPRIGVIRFNAERENRRKFILSFLFGVVLLLGIVLFYLTDGALHQPLSNFLQKNIFLIFVAVFWSVIYVVGVLLKNKRFHYYSLLWVGLVVSSILFGYEISMAMIGLGILMMGVALVLMKRFMGKYSLAGMESGVDNESE